MGIFDRFYRRQEKSKSPTGQKIAASIDRLSAASDEAKVTVAMELLKSSDYKVKAAVCSEIARLGIRAVGVWYELANKLADDNESVRLAAAETFWQLDGVDYAIRSLRDEHENPSQMRKEQAIEGIATLLKTSNDKTLFISKLEENWESYPKLNAIKKEIAEDYDNKMKEIVLSTTKFLEPSDALKTELFNILENAPIVEDKEAKNLEYGIPSHAISKEGELKSVIENLMSCLKQDWVDLKANNVVRNIEKIRLNKLSKKALSIQLFYKTIQGQSAFWPHIIYRLNIESYKLLHHKRG